MTSGAIGMKLVGGLHLADPEGYIDFLANLFPRLAEVKHAGDIARFVMYGSGADEQDYFRFLGVEVDGIEDIPDEMIVLDICENHWTLHQPKDGKDIVIWNDCLSWQWSCMSANARLIGEFSAKCPSEWSSSGIGAARNFQILANGYMGGGENENDDVKIVDYDPSWPDQFDRIASWIKDELGTDFALRVEHYGSTAIPGMPAKPAIDVLVEVPSFEAARKRAIPLFDDPNCEYWVYSEHMVFVIRNDMGQRTHHIHMAPADHVIWKGLAFRDYLREHNEEALRYAALKYELAERYRTDRECYTDAKTEYVQKVTAKALQES